MFKYTETVINNRWALNMDETLAIVHLTNTDDDEIADVVSFLGYADCRIVRVDPAARQVWIISKLDALDRISDAFAGKGKAWVDYNDDPLNPEHGLCGQLWRDYTASATSPKK